jgi:hypothetical protein
LPLRSASIKLERDELFVCEDTQFDFIILLHSGGQRQHRHTDKHCVNASGAGRCNSVIRTNNVEVDYCDLICSVDRAHAGMRILELTRPARAIATIKWMKPKQLQRLAAFELFPQARRTFCVISLHLDFSLVPPDRRFVRHPRQLPALLPASRGRFEDDESKLARAVLIAGKRARSASPAIRNAMEAGKIKLSDPAQNLPGIGVTFPFGPDLYLEANSTRQRRTL